MVTPGLGQFAAMEKYLGRIVALLEQPPVRAERIVTAESVSPTVLVGNSVSLDVQVQDLGRHVSSFSLLTITQLEIAAPGLAAADVVRLRIYRTGLRRDPQDLVTEFDGASMATGTWFASFSNRGIVYKDGNTKDTVWLQVRNTAGNSAATFFIVRLSGYAFP